VKLTFSHLIEPSRLPAAGDTCPNDIKNNERSFAMVASNIKTVRNDFWTLIKDAQALFREATATSGDKADAMRGRGLNMLDTAVMKAQDAQSVAYETGKDMALSADDYVRMNPWTAVAASAGIGLLVGMLIARSRY
jgi:ElaB/YqjD/DUF883 family membrane-anchored ribosome-binding protein